MTIRAKVIAAGSALVLVMTACLGAALMGSGALSLSGWSDCHAPVNQEQVITAWLADPVLQPQTYGIESAGGAAISRYCDEPLNGEARVPTRLIEAHASWQIANANNWYPLSALFGHIQPALAGDGWAYAGYSDDAWFGVTFCRTIADTVSVAQIDLRPPIAGILFDGPVVAAELRVWLKHGDADVSCPSPPQGGLNGHIGQSERPPPPTVSSDGVNVADAGPVPRRWWFSVDASITDTPTVAGGVVYLGTSRSDTDNAVYALDAVDGHERWRARIPGRVQGQLAVADGHLYVGSQLGWIVALDAATGTERWRTLTPYSSQPVERPGGQALVAVGGTVYIGASDSRLYALDAATGTIRWRSPAGLASPLTTAPTVVGSTVITVGADHGVNALDIHDGANVWRRIVADALGVKAVGSTLCVLTSRGEISAFDAATGDDLWQLSGEMAVPAPTVPGGLLVLDTRNFAYAVDLRTGFVEWHTSRPDVAGGARRGEALVYVSQDHLIYALDAATGQAVWFADIGRHSLSQPVAGDGVVVVAVDSELDERRSATLYAFGDPTK